MPDPKSESEFTEEEEATLERQMEEFDREEDAEVELKEEQKALEGEETEDKTTEPETIRGRILEETNEQKAERYQDILVGLGFKIFDNKEQGTACKLKTKELNIGRTFTDKQPTGKFWVKCLEDADFGKKGEFVKEEVLKEIPIIALFYRIRDGELLIPELEVYGKIIGKTDKAIQVQFTELNQIRSEWWGLKAVNRNKEGTYFIAAGFSRQTEKYPQQKMTIPRDIILPDYEEQLEKAPIQNGHQPRKESDGNMKRSKQMREAEEAKVKVSEEVKEGGKQIRDAIGEGLDIVIDVFKELELTDYEMADLATRIGQGINIDISKNRRTPRY